MNTTLKFDRVILAKEFNEKFKRVGDVFEIANILDNSFLLRDGNTRVAIGVISFEDFEDYFIPEENFKGWTKWAFFNGFDGQNDCMYRTNKKKVQVKFLKDNIKAEACCCKDDEFNLSLGLRIAYLRCVNKVFAKHAADYEEKLNMIRSEIADNENILKKMINSLGA